MHTRKTSPLPGPKDSINKYQIDYRSYYLDINKYLNNQIEARRKQEKLIHEQLNKYFKDLEKVRKKYKENIQELQRKEQNLKDKIQPLLQQLHRDQLEIKKLYDETEAIQYQMLDLLHQKENQVRKIKEHEYFLTHHQKMTFLHYQNLSFQMNVMPCSSSEQNDSQTEFEVAYNSQINRNNFNMLGELIKQQNNRQIQGEQTCYNSAKQSQTAKQSQGLLPILLPINQNQGEEIIYEKQQIEEELSTHEAINEKQTEVKGNNQQIKSKIEQYVALQQKSNSRREANHFVIQQKICIELGSSIDERSQNGKKNLNTFLNQMRGTDKNQNQTCAKSRSCEDQIVKPIVKPKRSIKECITILD